MDFVEVANLNELRENRKKYIELNNEKILLVFLKGIVYAINSVCPHRGNSLENGELDDEEIICPGHGFMFNIKDGSCFNLPGCSVRTYRVKVDDGKVFVGI